MKKKAILGGEFVEKIVIFGAKINKTFFHLLYLDQPVFFIICSHYTQEDSIKMREAEINPKKSSIFFTSQNFRNFSPKITKISDRKKK